MESETVKVIGEMQSEIDLYERKIDNILMAILFPDFKSIKLEENGGNYSQIMQLLHERSKDELKTQKTPATTIDQGDKPIESDKEAIEKAVAEKPYLKEGDLVVCDGLMCQVLEFCNDNKAKIRDLIGREKEVKVTYLSKAKTDFKHSDKVVHRLLGVGKFLFASPLSPFLCYVLFDNGKTTLGVAWNEVDKIRIEKN